MSDDLSKVSAERNKYSALVEEYRAANTSLRGEVERLKRRLSEYELAREWVDSELTNAGHSPSTVFEAAIPEDMASAVHCALVVLGERAKAAEGDAERLAAALRKVDTGLLDVLADNYVRDVSLACRRIIADALAAHDNLVGGNDGG